MLLRFAVMPSVDLPESLSQADLLRLWDPLLRHVSDGVVIADAQRPDQPVILVNRAFERLTGYSADEVVGRNLRFLQGEDRAQPAIVTLRKAIDELREVRVLLRNYRKDGEMFWNEMTLTPVRDESDEVVSFLAVLHDVTLRRHLEELRRRQQALRSSEERFRQIAEHLDDAVWLTQSEGRQVLYSNAAYERIWGSPPAPPGSKAWLEPIHPDHRERARKLIPTAGSSAHRDATPGLHAEATNGASPEAAADARPADARSADARSAATPVSEVELRMVPSQGGERWVRARTFPIHGPEGRVVRWLGIAQDVTESRRVQEQLRRTNDALATTVQELARRNLQMLALNETVDHLQGCATWKEAEAALEECIPEIFPQEAGGLYLVQPSRRDLQPLVVWGSPAAPDRSFPASHCQALRRRREFWTDASHPPEPCRHYESREGISDLCLSLRNQSQVLGLLHLRLAVGDDPEAAQDLKASVLRFAVNAAEQIALTLANIQLRETLHTQAIQDPLTGLYNRRFFNDALHRELQRSTRRDTPVALLMIDLDHFKRVNDEMGHEAGDRLLREVAAMLRRGVRAEDVIARYGGEEFMVLLPETGLAEGQVLAERLRRAFKDLEVHHGGQSLGRLTFSVGVAARPESGDSPERLIQAADAALYRAKREGRDRVVASDPGAPTADS